MSTYEHDLVAARFAALTPRPLPGDWDDVLDRAGAVRPRRRRLARPLWRGGPRRKLVVALAVTALVAAVATAAYGTVRVLILDRGFIGLPPEGATPSAPDRGELVVSWFGRSATLPGRYGGPLFRVWVYADGRIIWSRSGSIPEGANELTSGYLERRLTPESIELLRSEVLALLDRTPSLLETIPDDPPQAGYHPSRSALFVPPDYGSGWGSVEVADGDHFLHLSWEHACPPPAIAHRCEQAWPSGVTATQDQLSALRRVDALLTDPASVLPASAWAVRKIRAYVPSHYAVCLQTSPPKDASDLLALLPTRAADVLRDKSRTSSEGDVVSNLDQQPGHMVVVGRSVTYCSKLSTEDTREVAEALSGFDRDPGFHNIVLAYRLAEPTHRWNLPTSISFEPFFPHGKYTCSACG
jgi:hypothetical protein